MTTEANIILCIFKSFEIESGKSLFENSISAKGFVKHTTETLDKGINDCLELGYITQKNGTPKDYTLTDVGYKNMLSIDCSELL